MISYISHMDFTHSGRFDDTWVFDLGTQEWADVSPGGDRPIQRCLHRCALDRKSNSLMLFGGQSNKVPILDDLWRYDPSSKAWTEVALEGERPLPRFFSSLVMDPDMRRLLLFGGATSEGLKNDLWHYVQGEDEWAQIDIPGVVPEARSNHTGVFVTDTSSYYVFGGKGQSELNDLWVLQPG